MGFLIHTVMSNDKAKGMKAVMYACIPKVITDEDQKRFEYQFNRCGTSVMQREMELVTGYSDECDNDNLCLTYPGMISALSEIDEGRANALIIITQKGVEEDEETLMQIRNRVSLASGTLFFDHYLSFDEPDGNAETGNSNFINAISTRTPQQFEEARHLMVDALYRTFYEWKRKEYLESLDGAPADLSIEQAPSVVESPNPRKTTRNKATKIKKPVKKAVIPATEFSNVIFY